MNYSQGGEGEEEQEQEEMLFGQRGISYLLTCSCCIYGVK